jgi:NitT/TauT family transport system ATP-binding protein
MSGAVSGGPKLRVRNASKVYPTRSGDVLAIDRCSLDVEAGEIVSIVGPSGCGKTTLLWAMSGLHGLTSGEVLLDDKPVKGPNPEIGMVFQEMFLSSSTTSIFTLSIFSAPFVRTPPIRRDPGPDI